MKTLIISDLHGHTTWEDIIKKEKPNKTIFLGDYVDTFDRNNTPEMQINNLERILDYKEKRGNKCILLLGNHDFSYISKFGQTCSGFNSLTKRLFDTIKDRFISNVQLIYIDNKLKTIFSHAGVSQYWLDEVACCKLKDVPNLDFCSHVVEFNYITGFNTYGDTISQSPIWIRPSSLMESYIKGYNQVVGHTPYRSIRTHETLNKETLYFCDALPHQYLVIEDGAFRIETYQNFTN